MFFTATHEPIVSYRSLKESLKAAGFSIAALLFTLIINTVYFQHVATYTMKNLMGKH